MKTFLHLLCCLALPVTVSAQIPGPVPPAHGCWHDLRLARHQQHSQQPAPMPPGGFWMTQEQTGTKGRLIIRFFDADQREIHADTLHRKRLDLRQKTVVNRLNERLLMVLSTQPNAYVATFR